MVKDSQILNQMIKDGNSSLLVLRKQEQYGPKELFKAITSLSLVNQPE